jgi:uncharacterized glyoxalase superfamily protein PhnB
MKIHELFAYLCVRDTAQAIAFYARAFGAKEVFRLTESSGRIGHAEVDFGGTVLMLSDEFPEYGIRAPQPGVDGPVFTLHIHTDDADAMIKNAVAAGARLEREPQDQFYGERSGVVHDPFGYRWNIGHSIEEVTPEEMQRRYTEAGTGS